MFGKGGQEKTLPSASHKGLPGGRCVAGALHQDWTRTSERQLHRTDVIHEEAF